MAAEKAAKPTQLAAAVFTPAVCVCVCVCACCSTIISGNKMATYCKVYIVEQLPYLSVQ